MGRTCEFVRNPTLRYPPYDAAGDVGLMDLDGVSPIVKLLIQQEF